MAKKDRKIKSDLDKVDRHVITQKEYDEAPELTDEQVASARRFEPSDRLSSRRLKR